MYKKNFNVRVLYIKYRHSSISYISYILYIIYLYPLCMKAAAFGQSEEHLCPNPCLNILQSCLKKGYG